MTENITRSGRRRRNMAESATNVDVLEHMGLVRSIAVSMGRNYPRHVDIEDLVQAGMVGLMEAAQRFDPEHGVPFAAFASRRIRGAINDSVRESAWMTRGARAKYKEIRTVEERLDERSHEFPRHDERRLGREARYGYTVGFVGDEGPGYKHDLINGTIEVHDFGPGCATQEMVFVPRDPNASIDDPVNEDDGWVMSYVHDATTNTANVVILEAQDFSGEPVATVHLPQRVPFGFHGNWVPTTD